MKKDQFSQSKELKHFFNEQLALWKKKNRSTMEDLALRCGVSPSYLGHIGRYGRVPGKPVLILLAFNFELADPHEIFRIAEVSEPWPYDTATKLRPSDESLPSFLRVDMHGFTNAIREIVRAETRPRMIRDITRGSPIRVGFNLHKELLFERLPETNAHGSKGFFPDLFHMISLTLQSRCEIRAVNFADALMQLERAELDLYGPISSTLPRFSKALRTHPIYRVALAALYRKRAAPNLKQLKPPKNIEELRRIEYQIAVLKDSMAHHFAISHLNRAEHDLFLCDTPEEALERITLTSLGRPAHIMLCDGNVAISTHAAHPNDYEPLFADKGKALHYFEDTIMVRPDWPDMVAFLNETLDFLSRSGSLDSLITRWIPEKFRMVFQVP